jgi:hypothetical protein
LKDQELWVCQRKKTEAPKTMGIKATNAKRLGFWSVANWSVWNKKDYNHHTHGIRMKPHEHLELSENGHIKPVLILSRYV